MTDLIAGWDFLSAIDQHIAASQRADVVVSDAMVNASLHAQYDWCQKHASPEGTIYANGAMRAALTAALAARGEPEA